jgi:LytS/YehU family sensor histidine kinase
MSSAESSESIFGKYLELFARTEIFIFVFMEIVTKLKTVRRVLFKEAGLKDQAVFTVLFGLFSIFGTYIGITDSSGAISNIRDLAPMIAGLVAGPIVGVAVGLIGGVHRLFLGGVTAVPCALATVLAGLLAGMVYRLLKGKLLGIIPSIGFAVAIELLHGGLALLIVQPFNDALEIVLNTVPKMIVAVSLGVGISIIIIQSTKDSVRPSATTATLSNLSTQGMSALWQALCLHVCENVDSLRKLHFRSRFINLWKTAWNSSQLAGEKHGSENLAAG